MKSQSIIAIAALLAIFSALPAEATFGWPYLTTGGQTTCPVTNPSWKLSGCKGGIVDPDNDGISSNGSPNLLYQFYPQFLVSGSGCNSAATCKALCNSWPYQNGKKLVPLNGKTDGCAYWSWNGNDDCYLYGCGVCKSATSFSTGVRCQNSEYLSGAGPFFDSCSGSGVKGDPHFTGADDSHFDFTGRPSETYCLVSDSHLHINAYYGGRYEKANNETKALTWIRQVALLWGHHTIKLFAREGAEWQYNNGYMARMEVDGKRVSLSQAGDSLSFSNDRIQLTWLSAKERSGDDEVDVYQVHIEGVVTLQLTLRPEVASLRTSKDGVVHFNLKFVALDLSDKAHGVLGQTYRSDHKDRLAKQELEFSELLQVEVVKGENAEGFLDGSVKDYVSSNLLSTDCRVSRFARLSYLDSETSRAIELNSGAVVSTHGLPRKALLSVA